ncbi:MAG: 3',5'-cyclic AMP phosphodiesterase CpdA [Bradymonadia bacterium]
MTTIVQLTDVHVAEFSGLRKRDFLTKRLSGYVNYRRSRASEYGDEVLADMVAETVKQRPDHAVVTGDLSNLGLVSEWVAAKQRLQPIAEAGIPLTVIPGNHDAYLNSSKGGEFERIYAKWQVQHTPATGPYPFVARVGNVSLIHLDSAIPRPVMVASGHVGAQQLECAASMAAHERAEGQVIVLAIHHHVTRAPHKKSEARRGIINVREVREMIREVKPEVVMHGHNHYFHMRRMRGAEDTLIVGCSSSTTRKTTPKARRGQALRYTFDSAGLTGLATHWWGSDGFEPVTLDDVPVESAHEALD